MMTSGFKRCSLTLNLEHLWVQSSKQPPDLGLFFFSLQIHKFDGLSKHPNLNISKLEFTDAIERCSVTVEIKAAFIQC